MLRSNPLQKGSSQVRKLAVKVIMQEEVDQNIALNITSRLLQDQDFKVRVVYIELIRANLHKLYPLCPKHVSKPNKVYLC